MPRRVSIRLGAPRRSAAGVAPRRLALLLAVLEKRLAAKMIQQDVIINIPGGLRAAWRPRPHGNPPPIG